MKLIGVLCIQELQVSENTASISQGNNSPVAEVIRYTDVLFKAKQQLIFQLEITLFDLESDFFNDGFLSFLGREI